MKRRHSFLFSVLVLLVSGTLFFAPDPTYAAVRCPAPEAPARVNIKTVAAKIIYKTGKSSSDLQRMQRQRGRLQGAGNWRVLGLTLTEFRYAIKTAAMMIPVKGGGYCAQPVSYDLSVGFSDFQVHIDRKYKRGSCEFAAIRDHEITHVTLFRSNLSRYLPLIKRQARAAATAVKSVAVNDPDSGAQNLQDQMQRRMGPLIKKLNRDANTANARIDTAKSYRNVQMLCDNW